MKPAAQKLAVLVLGLLVGLILLELGLRLLGRFYQPMDTRGAALTRRLGDRTRIAVLCMGDSFTYGIGATSGNAYPDQLERLLNKGRKDAPYVVINGGIAGANSAMTLAALPEYLEAVKPALVTVMIGGNNLTNFYGYSSYLAESRPHGAASWGVGDALHKVRVYRLSHLLNNTVTRKRAAVLLDGHEAVIAAYLGWYRSSDHQGTRAPRTDRFLAGVHQLRFNQPRAAMAHFKAGIEAARGDSSNYWGMAMAHNNLRRPARAREWYSSCLRVNRQDPGCHFGMGEFALHNYFDRRIFTHFDDGMRVAPRFTGNYWGKAMAYLKEGPEDEGIKLFERCIEINPNDARCYPNLIAAARRIQQLPRVSQFLKKFAGTSAVARDFYQRLRTDGDLMLWVASDLSKMVKLCTRRGVAVLIVGYPGEDTANDALSSVARRHKLTYVPSVKAFQKLDRSGVEHSELFLPDGHCTDRGYGVIAGAVNEMIRRHKVLPLKTP